MGERETFLTCSSAKTSSSESELAPRIEGETMMEGGDKQYLPFQHFESLILCVAGIIRNKQVAVISIKSYCVKISMFI